MNLKHTMTSREIAELTKQRHDNVRRDIKAMAEVLSLKIEEKPEGSNGGRPAMVYHLDRDLTMTLVTKYDTARRYAVVRRWRELEEC